MELLERITTQHAFMFFYFPQRLSCKDKRKSLMVFSNYPSTFDINHTFGLKLGKKELVSYNPKSSLTFQTCPVLSVLHTKANALEMLNDFQPIFYMCLYLQKGGTAAKTKGKAIGL